MPAFTQLCRHVNISIWGNMLTLYPKHRVTRYHFVTEVSGRVTLRTTKVYNKAIYNLLDTLDKQDSLYGKNELGKIKYLHRYDAGHALCHQDHFNRNGQHSHMVLGAPIDTLKLSGILDLFIQASLVDETEKAECLLAFEQANQLEPEAAHKDTEKPYSTRDNRSSFFNAPAPNNEQKNDNSPSLLMK